MKRVLIITIAILSTILVSCNKTAVSLQEKAEPEEVTE